jgi:hypothetical protein
MEGVWWETGPKSKKFQSRALVKKDLKKCQVLIEIAAAAIRTEKDGRVVVIAEGEVEASNIVWVGDQWVRPRVLCKVFAHFSAGDLEGIRRRKKERMVRKNSPILFSSL